VQEQAQPKYGAYDRQPQAAYKYYKSPTGTGVGGGSNTGVGTSSGIDPRYYKKN